MRVGSSTAPSSVWQKNGRFVKSFYFLRRAAQGLGSHAALIFLIWSLWLAFEYFCFGPLSYVRIHDNADSVLASKLALHPQLGARQFGYWILQSVSGLDRFSSGFTIEFDSLLFAALPGWLAYGLMMWLQRFVAGYFTFRLVKESLNLDMLPSLYAGLAYSLFAQGAINQRWAGFTLYDGLGLPGLPFLLWAIGRIDVGRMYRRYMYAGGLGILVSVTSHYAFAVFLVPVVFYWSLFVAPKSTQKVWGLLVPFTCGWLLSELPILWSSFLNGPLSHRAFWLPNSPLAASEPGRLSFTLGVIRDNAVPLGLASLGLVISRTRDYRLVTLGSAIVFCLGFLLVYSSLATAVYKYFGFLSGFQVDRVYLLVPFLAIASAAVAVNLIASEWCLELTKQRSDRYSIPLQTVVVVIAIGLIAWQSVDAKHRTFSGMLNGSNFATLYRQRDLQHVSEYRKSLPPFRIGTITDLSRHVQHPAYAWAYGLETADGYVNLYSKRYQEFWEQVLDPLLAIDRARYNYFHYWGSRIYLFSPSNGFPDSGQVRFQDYYNLKLLSLANVLYIASPVLIYDEDLTLLPSRTRDYQIAWQSNRFRHKFLDMLKGQYPGIPLYIYENRQVLPRFFIVGQARVFDRAAQVLTALREASYDDLRSIAYLEMVEAIRLPLSRLGGETGEVKLRTYSADRIALRVVVKSPSLLIVANNYSPFWRARVDQEIVRVVPVNHAFQGVYLEDGEHDIVLEYAPPYAFRFGE